MNKEAQPSKDKIPRIVVLVFTLLIVISPIITAYSAWQAIVYNHENARMAVQALGLQTLSNRYVGMGNAERLVDVVVFSDWVSAKARNETLLASFLEERFREEFRPAFYAWLNSANATGKIPPGTPFSRPEYKNANFEKSGELQLQIENLLSQAEVASAYAQRLVLVTLFMGVVIVMASSARGMRSMRLRLVVLAVALALFVMGLASALSVPPAWNF